MDQINASAQAINLFPPAQEGLNPIIMNPPQVLVKTCLTTHIYTQEKRSFFSQDRQKVFLFSTSSHMSLWIQNYPSPPKPFQKYSAAMSNFWKRASVPPTLFTEKQTSHLHCYCRQKDRPTCTLQLWKIQLHLLFAQTTANKMRDLRDYSTFSLYSSKQITLQDQLPTSFSFF